MNVRIKDPGSAITHFIGMMMAMFASTPLLIKAARQPDEIHLIALGIYYQYDFTLCGKYSVSYIGFVGKSKQKIKENRPYDDFCVNCRNLYSNLYHCTATATWNTVVKSCLGNCNFRDRGENVLGDLSKMVFLCLIHQHGLDLCAGIYTAFKQSSCSCLWMAFGRRNHLHHWRRHLCIETSDF